MDYSDFAMFQFTNCGMFRAKKIPLYAVVQGVAEGMRADTRSGRAKAIAAFLCPSAESEPSLAEVSSLRFSLLLLYNTSSFQVVILRFRWCVDAKVYGMFVCEIKPIVWQIFFEISAKTIDRNTSFIHMFA